MSVEAWITRLLYSALLGGLVGMERQAHGRPAGLRTHMLVSMAACVVTISGIMIASGFSERIDQRWVDVTRVIAGVVTGVGFLGAGAIMKTSNLVRGLTTAACIWLVAVLGIVAGLGMYAVGGAATIIAVFVLTVLAFAERRIPALVHRDILITLEGTKPDFVLNECRTIAAEERIAITDTEAEVSVCDSESKLLLHLRMRGRRSTVSFVERITQLEGIKEVTWQRMMEEL
jgi:putative Mg2+ transporter-C (MgtC) family protein